MKPDVSVVIPVYNVEHYLPRFLDSLQAQSFKNFEALFIDDASGDNGPAIVEGAASRDARIKLLRHPRRLGAGAARNTGIRSALGTALCFADPDDLLPEQSLDVRYAAFAAHDAVVRGCNDDLSQAGTVIRRATRPEGLPLVFRPRDVARECGIDHFLNGHWTWLFPTALIRDKGIENGENMRTAEDIMFLARLFFHVERMVWLPDVVYQWIRRDDSLSASVYTTGHYADYFACCDALYEQARQRAMPVLGDMFCDVYLLRYLEHLMRQYAAKQSLKQDVRKVVGHALDLCEKHGALKRVCGASGQPGARYTGFFILWSVLRDPDPLMVERLSRAMNATVNRQYADVREKGWRRPVCFDKFDQAQGLLRARYLFCGDPPVERFTHAGRAVKPAFAKNRLEFQGDDFTVFERILWLPTPEGPGGKDGLLELQVGGEDAGLRHTPEEARAAFKPVALDERGFPPDILAVRRLAKSAGMRRLFNKAWLFIDKDIEADDNAEHLYRHVMRKHPEVNAWFVLSPDSRDWDRLEKEGFRLIPHGSMEHKVLFVLCENLISSQMDPYIFSFLEEKFFTDLREAKFICLQHGVIKDDLSRWLNPVPMDMFVVTTNDERASIVDDGTAYVMTAKEVRLSGQPRYDALLEPAEKEKIILVMPTWRADLVGAWDGKGQKRELNPEFFSSSYVARWRELFADPRLKALVDAYGYQVVFFAHPAFADYLPGMPFPDFVEKRSKEQGSMQAMLKKSGLMITDFTSAAFDMAYMRRPILYYQPESAETYTKSQNWAKGYLHYETMGFGPVCATPGELFAALEDLLRDGCAMPARYEARVDATFPYRDADFCRRTFAFIVAASRPFPQE